MYASGERVRVHLDGVPDLATRTTSSGLMLRLLVRQLLGYLTPLPRRRTAAGGPAGAAPSPRRRGDRAARAARPGAAARRLRRRPAPQRTRRTRRRRPGRGRRRAAGLHPTQQNRPGRLGDFVGIAHGHPADTCTATCPIRAWREWRTAMAAAVGTDDLPADSPAFRPITRHGRLGIPTDPDVNSRLTGQSVALIVKNAVALLGDPQRFPTANYGHLWDVFEPIVGDGVAKGRRLGQFVHQEHFLPFERQLIRRCRSRVRRSRSFQR
jgi:hypothetical protein